jgi:hypothetical protein
MLDLSLPSDLDNMSKPASEQRHCSIDAVRIAEQVRLLQRAEAEAGGMVAEEAAVQQQCAEHLAVLVDMAVVVQVADGTFAFDQAIAIHAVRLFSSQPLVCTCVLPSCTHAACALVATTSAEVAARWWRGGRASGAWGRAGHTCISDGSFVEDDVALAAQCFDGAPLPSQARPRRPLFAGQHVESRLAKQGVFADAIAIHTECLPSWGRRLFQRRRMLCMHCTSAQYNTW